MSFETYDIKQGQIMIAFSDNNMSMGTLNINPGQELQKHNRPVKESLFQIKGRCIIKIFDDDQNIRDVILKEGDSIDIQKEKYHIHSNPYNELSITFWKADGNITNIIDNIRKNSRM